jgi:hypothetical protein
MTCAAAKMIKGSMERSIYSNTYSSPMSCRLFHGIMLGTCRPADVGTATATMHRATLVELLTCHHQLVGLPMAGAAAARGREVYICMWQALPSLIGCQLVYPRA